MSMIMPVLATCYCLCRCALSGNPHHPPWGAGGGLSRSVTNQPDEADGAAAGNDEGLSDTGGELAG